MQRSASAARALLRVPRPLKKPPTLLAIEEPDTDFERGKSYEDVRNEEIKKSENAGLHRSLGNGTATDQFWNPVPGSRSGQIRDNLTAGFGWDLREKGFAETEQAFREAGISVTQEQMNILRAFDEGSKLTFRTGKKNVRRVPTQQDVLAAWEGRPITEREATALLNLELEKREKALDKALGPFRVLPKSRERAAIISLGYNIAGPDALNLDRALPNTMSELRQPARTPRERAAKRARIWREFALGSNRDRNDGNQRGLQRRRLAEAKLFGLYSQTDPDPGADLNDRARKPRSDDGGLEARTVLEVLVTDTGGGRFASYLGEEGMRRYLQERDLPQPEADVAIGVAFEPARRALRALARPVRRPDHLDQHGQQGAF